MRQSKNLRSKRSPQKLPRLERAPTLRFSPYAWAKLLFLRDQGETEIGGFGITAEYDPLLMEDIVLVLQTCTAVSVRFDDAAVADFYDDQVDRGFAPDRFCRVWVHTHPGNSAQPSGTDEETLERVFGRCDWSVMFILACGGDSYARLRLGTGPTAEMTIPIEVDYDASFPASDIAAWEQEYENCVRSIEGWKETNFNEGKTRTNGCRPTPLPNSWWDDAGFDLMASDLSYSEEDCHDYESF